MTDNQENTVAAKDMSAYPEVDQHPKYKNKEAANLDSNLNQDLIQMAEYLKANKDKADSPDYLKCLESVHQMAEKGYAVAQVEYAKFLYDAGEFTDSAKYFDKALQNKNIDKNTARHLKKHLPHLPKESQLMQGEKYQELNQLTQSEEPFKERYKKHPEDYPLVQELEKHADNNHQETEQYEQEYKETMQQDQKYKEEMKQSENNPVYQRLIQRNSR